MRQRGELEAVIMDRLWEWGRPALVREMVDALHDDRPLAYTAVMTVMENLQRKGWLRRERDGRAWRYEPTGSPSPRCCSRWPRPCWPSRWGGFPALS
jgi:predicted transcriptional regulator